MNEKICQLEEANDVLKKKICDFEIDNKKLLLQNMSANHSKNEIHQYQTMIKKLRDNILDLQKTKKIPKDTSFNDSVSIDVSQSQKDDLIISSDSWEMNKQDVYREGRKSENFRVKDIALLNYISTNDRSLSHRKLTLNNGKTFNNTLEKWIEFLKNRKNKKPERKSFKRITLI